MLLESLLPAFVYFLIGIAIQRAGMITAGQAQFLFRLVFFVTLPALVYVVLGGATISRTVALLPLVAFVINVITFAAARWYATRAGLDARDSGGLLFGASLTNMLVVFAFVQTMLPPNAMAAAVLYDLGNAVFLATVANAVALRIRGEQRARPVNAVMKLLRSPLMIAVIAGLVTSLQLGGIPPLIGAITRPLGFATIPVTLIALGAVFDLKALRGAVPVVAITLRMGGGLAAGVAAILLLSPEPLIATVLLVSAAAPIGFSSVAMVSVAGLDAGRAAATVSLSVLVGLFVAPALIVTGRFVFGLAG